MGTISLYSNKTAWCGELEWSYSEGYVTVTMYTWKTDGYPSSSPSGGDFQATIAIGGNSKTFAFQQQEIETMVVGTHSVRVSGKEVTISGQVTAPYGVSMYNNPLAGSATVILYEEEPEKPSPSEIMPGATSIQMGGTLNISLLRYNTQCTHTLKYRAAGSEEEWITIEANVGYFYGWKVPDLSAWCTDSLSVNVDILCITYLQEAVCGETSAQVEVLLPDATKPSCSESAIMGTALAITLERLSAGFVHDLYYTLESQTGQIAQGVETAVTWAVPIELAKGIPQLSKATMLITCVTRLGDLEVGRETCTVSLTVPNNILTRPIASMKLSPTGDLGGVFAGMYIRGRTGVRAEFTAHSAYSEVKSFALLVDGVKTTGNPAVSSYLRSHGTVTITGQVTDARGFMCEVTQQIQVAAYDRPSVIPYPGESNVVAVRCDADGTRNPKGQHLLIRAGRKYTALSTDDGQLNYCTLQYRIKKAGAKDYSDYYTLIGAENLETDYVELTVLNGVPDLRSSYTVQLEAVDSLGGYSVITQPVAALTVPLHIGRGTGNMAVGKYCDYSRSNAFEIGFTTYFDTGIAMKTIFTDGQWQPGMLLSNTVADAEVSAIDRYTLFMGVCQGVPVWLMKWGQKLFGTGIRINLADGQALLEEAPAAVAALYAVL